MPFKKNNPGCSCCCNICPIFATNFGAASELSSNFTIHEGGADPSNVSWVSGEVQVVANPTTFVKVLCDTLHPLTPYAPRVTIKVKGGDGSRIRVLVSWALDHQTGLIAELRPQEDCSELRLIQVTGGVETVRHGPIPVPKAVVDVWHTMEVCYDPAGLVMRAIVTPGGYDENTEAAVTLSSHTDGAYAGFGAPDTSAGITYFDDFDFDVLWYWDGTATIETTQNGGVNDATVNLFELIKGGTNIFDISLSWAGGADGAANINVIYDGSTQYTFVADNAKSWAEEEEDLEAVFGAGNVSITGSGTTSRTYQIHGLTVVDPASENATVGANVRGTSPTVFSVFYPVASNERQQLILGATSGTFTLTWNGETTAAIDYDADASELQTALEGLPSISSGDVSVTGGWVVEFTGTYAQTDVSLMSAATGALVLVLSEIQTLTIDATGGTYKLTFAGTTTDDLDYDASAATIQAALEGLSTIGSGNVTVTGTNPFTITFAGDLALMDVAAIVPNDLCLADNECEDGYTDCDKTWCHNCRAGKCAWAVGHFDDVDNKTCEWEGDVDDWTIDATEEHIKTSVLPSVSLTIAEATKGGVGVNEEQSITIATVGGSSSGTFTLTYGGETTSAIAHDASAAEVEAALEALSTIGVGNVSVTVTWLVEFIGALAATDVAMMTGDDGGLTARSVIFHKTPYPWNDRTTGYLLTDNESPISTWSSEFIRSTSRLVNFYHTHWLKCEVEVTVAVDFYLIVAASDDENYIALKLTFDESATTGRAVLVDVVGGSETAISDDHELIGIISGESIKCAVNFDDGEVWAEVGTAWGSAAYEIDGSGWMRTVASTATDNTYHGDDVGVAVSGNGGTVEVSLFEAGCHYVHRSCALLFIAAQENNGLVPDNLTTTGSLSIVSEPGASGASRLGGSGTATHNTLIRQVPVYIYWAFHLPSVGTSATLHLGTHAVTVTRTADLAGEAATYEMDIEGYAFSENLLTGYHVVEILHHSGAIWMCTWSARNEDTTLNVYARSEYKSIAHPGVPIQYGISQDHADAWGVLHVSRDPTRVTQDVSCPACDVCGSNCDDDHMPPHVITVDLGSAFMENADCCEFCDLIFGEYPLEWVGHLYGGQCQWQYSESPVCTLASPCSVVGAGANTSVSLTLTFVGSVWRLSLQIHQQVDPYAYCTGSYNGTLAHHACALTLTYESEDLGDTPWTCDEWPLTLTLIPVNMDSDVFDGWVWNERHGVFVASWVPTTTNGITVQCQNINPPSTVTLSN